MTPHPDCGRFRVLPCRHLDDDPDIVPGSWDLDLLDYYGNPVTIGEFPTHADAVAGATPDEYHRWREYLVPFRGEATDPRPEGPTTGVLPVMGRDCGGAS